MADEFKGISNETLRNIEALKSSMKEISSATNKTNKALQEQGLLIADHASSYSRVTQSANKFAELQDKAKKSASATSSAIKEQQKQLSIVRSLNAQIDNLYDQILNANTKQEKVLRRQVDNLSAARDNAAELAKEFGSLADDSSKLDKSTAWFSAISGIIKDIPGLRKLSSPFEAAAKASRETVINNAKNKTINDAINSLGKEALKTGTGLKKAKLEELGLTVVVGQTAGRSAALVLRKWKEQNKEQSVFMNGLRAGFESLGPIIRDALGPFAILDLIVKAVKSLIGAAFEVDKQVTQIAKNFNISKEAARGTFDNLEQMTLEANNFRLSIDRAGIILRKELIESTIKINDLLGTAVDFTYDLGQNGRNLAEQFGTISKFLALSDDEQKGLLQSTLTTGESIDDIEKTVLGTTRLRKLESGILINERRILKDVLTASNAIKLTVKGGAEGLTRAAIAAAELGSNLKDVARTTDSLLDFESSISNELEAELLTGRNINLERARLFAINGDIEGLAREINQQLGSSAEFSKMNVIQQQALAKTFGYNRDELADILVEQESLNKLKSVSSKLDIDTLEQLRKSNKITADQYNNLKQGRGTASDYYASLKAAGLLTKDIVKDLGDVAAQSLESQDAQQKFNDALDRAKEAFSTFVNSGVLESLANIVQTLATKGLFGLFGGATKTFETPEEKKQREIREKQTAIDQKTKQEVISASGYPFENTNDALIRPGMPPIKFNKDDLILAGTNLVDTNSNKTGNTLMSKNDDVVKSLTEQNTLLKELIRVTEKNNIPAASLFRIQ